MSIGKKRLLAYIIMIFSLIISISLVKDIIKLLKSDDRIIEAEEELMTVKMESEEFKNKFNELEAGEWWERQVRDALKMSRENEVVVIVPEELITNVADREVFLEKREKEEPNYRKWWKLFVY